MITAENVSLLPAPPVPPAIYASSHILLTQPTYTHHCYHQPDTHIAGPNTLLKPNQTATLVKPYRMVKTGSEGCKTEEPKSFLFFWFCVPVI